MSNRRFWIIVAGVVLWVGTSIPLGMGLYAMKSWLGWEVSPRGGFHSLQRCMAKEWASYEAAAAKSPSPHLFGDLKADLMEDRRAFTTVSGE